MVEESKDSLAQSAPVVDEAVAVPEIPSSAADQPVQDIADEKSKPARTRKAAAVADEAPVAEAPAFEASAKPDSTPTAVKPAKVKPAAKTLAKARKAKPPVADAPAPAVKPANKRPSTANPRVKQISAVGPKPSAPRKELFAMATKTDMTEKMTAAFKDAQEKAKAALEKSQAAFGDAGEFAKGNVEAVVESTKILASGLQEMTKGYVAETKSVFEAMTADVKELTTVKSPTEFFEKQSALLRKNFDAAVAASSKNSEAMLKLANEAFQPISTRVSLAVEKIKKAA